MSPLPGKVLPSSTVAPMAREMRPAPLNPDSARNPSLTNGNAPPTVPASHRRNGMEDAGTNGPSVPRYPLGQRDR
jgi:hypothetical protein